MTAPPLLTISVPTYNRSRHLSFLLTTLERELRGLEGQIRVLVSDNASTDNTSIVVADFMTRMPELRSRRNELNQGSDANISACYLLPDTPYVWVLGDDDAPFIGTLPLLLGLLRKESPDMIYLPSLSTPDIVRDHSSRVINRLKAIELDREDFASVLHIQMTFISGLVLRKRPELDARVRTQLDVTQGTSLVQLAWVLEILKYGHRFLFCCGHPIMATAANSGGYAVFQVFLVNHTRIVTKLLAEQPTMRRRILRQTSLCFLPGLVWHVRHGLIGNFKMQDRGDIDLPEELTRTNGFRWLVRPIWSLPHLAAKVVFFCSRVLTFTVRQYHQKILFPRRPTFEICA